jgi:hypothetical protein
LDATATRIRARGGGFTAESLACALNLTRAKGFATDGFWGRIIRLLRARARGRNSRLR